MAIYALKPDVENPEWISAIFKSLKEGQVRYGWSYVPTADLHFLQDKITKKGWESLTKQEKDCWQPFLLSINVGDYIVFINTPSYGKCTYAQISKEYYFDWHDDLEDANHCFDVDITSIKTFDRNGKNVHPLLSRRLKLQGKYWQIYAEKEFNDLVKGIETNQPVTEEGKNVEFLKNDLQPIWESITNKIHKTHPGKDLERLISRVFSKMPNTKVVENGFGWRTDYGADIIVHFTEGPADFPTLQIEKIMVVQVKSYEGEHWSLQAVNDIKSAVQKYQAHMGLILTTAKSTPHLEQEVEKAAAELNVPIAICAGSDVGKLVAKYLLSEMT